MNILSIVAISIISLIIINMLTNVNKSFAMLASVVAGIVLLAYLINYFTDILNTFNNIVELSGVDNTLFATVLKVVGIGYLTQYTIDLCKDFAVNSLADKVGLAGKMCIFAISLPLVYQLINTILDIIK